MRIVIDIDNQVGVSGRTAALAGTALPANPNFRAGLDTGWELDLDRLGAIDRPGSVACGTSHTAGESSPAAGRADLRSVDLESPGRAAERLVKRHVDGDFDILT